MLMELKPTASKRLHHKKLETTHIPEIIRRLEKEFGEPVWRGNGDPLSSLIKTVMSQSTNDRNRDTAYTRLVERYPTWKDVMEAPAEDIAATIRVAGLANQKSQRIKDILRWINDTFGSLNIDFICEENPDKVIETFTALKGIGIKTISVVLMFTCGVDIFPVDTHVHRICRRLALVPENASAIKTYHLMQPLVLENKSYSLHMNFLKLGRQICIAQAPRCGKCPLNDLCPTGKKLLEHDEH